MADDKDKQSEIDKLLAEVDGVVGRTRDASAAPTGRSKGSPGQRLNSRARVAVVSGVIAAAVVWAIFAILPFLGAFSGAAGAFLATFASVFLLRRKD